MDHLLAIAMAPAVQRLMSDEQRGLALRKQLFQLTAVLSPCETAEGRAAELTLMKLFWSCIELSARPDDVES